MHVGAGYQEREPFQDPGSLNRRRLIGLCDRCFDRNKPHFHKISYLLAHKLDSDTQSSTAATSCWVFTSRGSYQRYHLFHRKSLDGSPVCVLSSQLNCPAVDLLFIFTLSSHWSVCFLFISISLHSFPPSFQPVPLRAETFDLLSDTSFFLASLLPSHTVSKCFLGA